MCGAGRDSSHNILKYIEEVMWKIEKKDGKRK